MHMNMAPHINGEDGLYTSGKRNAEDGEPPLPKDRVKSSNSQCRFLQLPRELRDLIFKYLLRSPKPIQILDNRSWSRRDTAVFPVSRQCREEAMSAYYRVNELYYGQMDLDTHQCDNWEKFDDFFKGMGLAAAADIKHVAIDLELDFKESCERLRQLEHLLCAFSGLTCLKVTLRPYRPSVDLILLKRDFFARAAVLVTALPAPASASRKWIRRWCVDEVRGHLWYVPDTFKMTRWVKFPLFAFLRVRHC
jgi:hypothetical protein